MALFLTAHIHKVILKQKVAIDNIYQTVVLMWFKPF